MSPATGSPRFPKRLTLPQRFAIESLVAIAVFAAVIGAISVRQMERMLVTSSAHSIATSMNAVVLDAVGDAGIEALGVGQRARLDGVVRRSIQSGDIVAVKLWDRQSTVVYSSEPGQDGRRVPEDAEVQAALRGEIGWASDLGERADSASQATHLGDSFSVYSPIRASSAAPAVGAVEIYMPFAPIRRQVNDTGLWLWAGTVAAALVLYGIQVRLVNDAAKRLRTTEAQVSEVNRRLEESMREAEEHSRRLQDSMREAEQHFRSLEDSAAEAEQHSIGTLRALNAAVDAKDSYTARHSLGVADYALVIGRRVGLDESDLRDLEQAGLLHDLGKIGVPEAILLKPKRLTREEFLVVCDHSETGARIIESIPSLERLVPIVRHHHERWDGTGYPRALSGCDIPLLARVLAVADAYEAMTSDRPYRRAMKPEAVRAEFERGTGLQFDPALAQVVLEALDAGEMKLDVHVS